MIEVFSGLDKSPATCPGLAHLGLVVAHPEVKMGLLQAQRPWKSSIMFASYGLRCVAWCIGL
jgi:hypothetical protein